MSPSWKKGRASYPFLPGWMPQSSCGEEDEREGKGERRGGGRERERDWEVGREWEGDERDLRREGEDEGAEGER